MELARQVLAVIAVFGLLSAALWTLRRAGSMRLRLRDSRTRSLASIERLALTPQHSLHLVKIHGREVVVATHPHGCALLGDRPQ